MRLLLPRLLAPSEAPLVSGYYYSPRDHPCCIHFLPLNIPSKFSPLCLQNRPPVCPLASLFPASFLAHSPAHLLWTTAKCSHCLQLGPPIPSAPSWQQAVPLNIFSGAQSPTMHSLGRWNTAMSFNTRTSLSRPCCPLTSAQACLCSLFLAQAHWPYSTLRWCLVRVCQHQQKQSWQEEKGSWLGHAWVSKSERRLGLQERKCLPSKIFRTTQEVFNNL